MKVSLNTIRQFIDFELPQTDELVARINSQLGQVEEVIDLTEKYKDVVIVKVVSAEKHPNADKLSVCLVDDGGVVADVPRNEEGYVQVVCGAPNVHADMFAAWLPPRSIVPASFDDVEPFVLDARELRGVVSQGMLAAPDELAIGVGHDGILEITEQDLPKSTIQHLQSGLKFAELFGLDDTIIDIENKMFTHRPDCFGQLGIARELSALLKGLPVNSEDTDTRFTNPDWYWLKPTFGSGDGLDLTVFNDVPEKAPRFMAVALSGVEVKPSPLWLQIELVRLGGKPINNIVDATNYMMLLTAQPTHAYDYDKLRGATLGVRMASSGETATFLNGKSYELTEDDMVIADSEGVIGLAGIIGGGNSEVSFETKNIVLEVANFDMYALRKSSMRHGIFTDACTRFSKGQSRLQNDRVLTKLMQLVGELGGGKQASPVFDQPNKDGQLDDVSLSGEIPITADFVNSRLGTKLELWEIGGLLRRANFASYPSGNDMSTLIVTAPFWRTDIELPEDMVEEVGRLYGFDKLPRELPQRSIVPTKNNAVFETKRRVRMQLRSAGANEVLTYSFVHENVLKRAGQDSSLAFRLSNALSPDLQYYRLSIIPSLLGHIHANSKVGYDEFAMFEFGKAHERGDKDNEGLPTEYSRLGFVYAAKNDEQSAYFTARRYAELVAPGLRYVPLDSFDGSSSKGFAQMVAPFDIERSAVLLHSEMPIGVVGEFKQAVKRAFKLPPSTAGFEIVQSHLLTIQPKPYAPLSKYPSVTQDISLKVANNVSYESLVSALEAELGTIKQNHIVMTLQPLSIYQAELDAIHKTITLRLVANSYEKTLTDAEVGDVMDSLAAAAHNTLNAQRI